MRKSLLLTTLAVLCSGGVALADNDIGCGPGTLIFKGQSGLMQKVFGATTNGSFGFQTFGISTGTFGCKREGVITGDARVNMFANANVDRLARDMAAGQGETLHTLARLIGVDEADMPAFYSLTQTHFDQIVPSEQVSSGEMLSSLERLMAADPALAKYAG